MKSDKKSGIWIIFVIALFSLLGLFLYWLYKEPKITDTSHIPKALESITAHDGSRWEQVNIPGFGSDNNMSVVAMAEYKDRLYAMTRNEAEGGEVWRTSGTGWEQVLFPGDQTNGIYGNNLINNLWGKIIAFQGKLYFGFSSGLQGQVLRSSGCEIWRYDGTTWEAVIADKKDTEESGTIKGIAGCEADDDVVTAKFTDSSKKWTIDQWAGGVLQITSGAGKYRRFDIIGNSADTLTVQENEVARGFGTEYTICENKQYKNSMPPYVYNLGTVQVGDSYEIGTGFDENGFGVYWNKSITDMVIHEKRLYVSTGLNYKYGSQVWYTEDGDNWMVTQPANSFGLFHDDPDYPNGKKAVCSSITCLSSSSVSGSEVLYAGGQGTSGNLGACARLAKLTEQGWELIVDGKVDENDTGTNENGFGDGMSCNMFTGNAMPWTLASFKDKLHAGINSLGGARVLYTPNASSEDGNWFYSAGGDSAIPNGFDGALNEGTGAYKIYQNVAVNLFPFKDNLYAGLVTTFAPAMGAGQDYLTGSHIWKSIDGTGWQQVTGNGFGDKHIVIFEAFANFGGTLYVSGSKGASSSTEGLGGAKIFRFVDF